MDIKRWLCEKIAEEIEQPLESIDNNSEFDQFNLDSLAIISLTFELEDFVNEELGTGLIIDPGNTIELKNSIIEILNNTEQFWYDVPEKIKEYSYEKFGENLEGLFKKCLND